jgi:hypothetical protein
VEWVVCGKAIYPGAWWRARCCRVVAHYRCIGDLEPWQHAKQCRTYAEGPGVTLGLEGDELEGGGSHKPEPPTPGVRVEGTASRDAGTVNRAAHGNTAAHGSLGHVPAPQEEPPRVEERARQERSETSGGTPARRRAKRGVCS